MNNCKQLAILLFLLPINITSQMLFFNHLSENNFCSGIIFIFGQVLGDRVKQANSISDGMTDDDMGMPNMPGGM